MFWMRIRIIKSGLAQSVERLFYKTWGLFLLFTFIIVNLNNCKVDFKVFIIRNNIHVLIYLSRMKSSLWGWSYYHYSLAQMPISHGIHIFLATLSIVQVRHLQTQLITIQLRNTLRVHMVCEWAWVLFQESATMVLSFGAQITRTGTYARTHTGKRAHLLLIAMTHTDRSTVIVNTKEPSLTECIIYLMRIPNGSRFTKRSPQPSCCS